MKLATSIENSGSLTKGGNALVYVPVTTNPGVAQINFAAGNLIKLADDVPHGIMCHNVALRLRQDNDSLGCRGGHPSMLPRIDLRSTPKCVPVGFHPLVEFRQLDL